MKKFLKPESPDENATRRNGETLEREIIFGTIKSYQFYLKIRDTVCPWDAERMHHRQDFTVLKYNDLYRIVDAHYRRLDGCDETSTVVGMPFDAARNGVVDLANANSISTDIAEQLIDEIEEEKTYTDNLNIESLLALPSSPGFISWLKARILSQAMAYLQTRKGLGALTLDSFFDINREALKAVRGLDVEIVSPPLNSTQDLDPGDFPVDALNLVMRAIAEQTAEVHCVDLSVTAMATIATLAAAIGKSAHVTGAVNGHTTNANLYVLIAAPKSYGKGASSQVVTPLLDASQLMTDQHLRDGLPRLKAEQRELKMKAERLDKQLDKIGDGAGQANLEQIRVELAGVLSRMSEIHSAEKSERTLWIGSATGAALNQSLAANNETLFSYSAEAGDMVRIALGRYSGDKRGDFDLFLSGYANEWTGQSRISSGTNRMRPCISTLWFCQPIVLDEILSSEEALSRGLTARMLSHVVERDTVPEDDGKVRSVTTAAGKAWMDLVNKVLAGRDQKDSLAIKCSAEAREVFRVFNNEAVGLRNGQLRHLEGELGRWRENAIRVAAGKWLADVHTGQCAADSMLSPLQAEHAVKLVRWVNLSMLRYMNRGRKLQRIEDVHNFLARVGRFGKEMTLRDVKNRLNVKRETVLSYLSGFEDVFRVVSRHNPKGGPSSEVLQLLA